jgi:hypothetical protein
MMMRPCPTVNSAAKLCHNLIPMQYYRQRLPLLVGPKIGQSAYVTSYIAREDLSVQWHSIFCLIHVYSALIGSTIAMSNGQSRIKVLASTICQAAAEIDNHLVTEGLPALSFSAVAPPILVLPPHLQNTRAELLDATAELHDLVTGPLNHLIGLTNPTVCNVAE